MNSHEKSPAYRRYYTLVMIVTLIRMPLALLFAVVLARGESDWRTVSAAVVLLTFIEVSDGLDGFLARRLGVTSKMGAIVDPYSDSVSRITIYWALAATGHTFSCMPLALAFRDITVAYCRILWTGANRSAGALLSGKIKAVVQGVGAFTLVLWPYLLPQWPWIEPVMSWIVLVATFASLVEYVGKTLPLLPTQR